VLIICYVGLGAVKCFVSLNFILAILIRLSHSLYRRTLWPR
ncbi:uncharacterized protein METZ01_LOCUS262208, partial [marine metagenome]